MRRLEGYGVSYRSLLSHEEDDMPKEINSKLKARGLCLVAE